MSSIFSVHPDNVKLWNFLQIATKTRRISAPYIICFRERKVLFFSRKDKKYWIMASRALPLMRDCNYLQINTAIFDYWTRGIFREAVWPRLARVKPTYNVTWLIDAIVCCIHVHVYAYVYCTCIYVLYMYTTYARASSYRSNEVDSSGPFDETIPDNVDITATRCLTWIYRVAEFANV